MNFNLKHIPERPDKPRKEGVTMVMDKGLSIRQAEDLLESAGHLIDFIKLGFGTSFVTKKLEEKITLLLNEVDVMRNELTQLRHENSSYRLEKVRHTQKLQEMISLFDMLGEVQGDIANNFREAAILQGEKEQIAVA